MAELESLDVHIDGSIGRIVLARPDRLNAFTPGMLTGIEATLDRFAQTSSVRVVVIEAAGKAFSVGHDLKDMVGRDEPFFQELFAMSAGVAAAIRRAPQPVIAKVHGVAAAAGLQLAAACDLVVASADARFGTTGLKVGLFCSTPMVPLARSIGRKRALEMLMTGDLIDARTAADWGLVNRVVAPEELETATTELALQISDHAPNVVALGKRAFYEQLELDELEAYGLGRDVMAGNAAAPDGQEGFTAFLEKRPANWLERSDAAGL